MVQGSSLFWKSFLIFACFCDGCPLHSVLVAANQSDFTWFSHTHTNTTASYDRLKDPQSFHFYYLIVLELCSYGHLSPPPPNEFIHPILTNLNPANYFLYFFHLERHHTSTYLATLRTTFHCKSRTTKLKA